MRPAGRSLPTPALTGNMRSCYLCVHLMSFSVACHYWLKFCTSHIVLAVIARRLLARITCRLVANIVHAKFSLLSQAVLISIVLCV